MILQALNFIHHLLVNSQSAGRIYDDNVIALCLRLFYGIVGYLIHLFALRLAIDGHTYLFSDYSQLLDGSRTINITGNKQWILMLFCL